MTRLSKRLEAMRRLILDKGRELVEEYAITGLSLVKADAFANGITVEGEKFSYSTRAISTSYFKGKELNSSGTRYIQLHQVGTWEAFRQAQGLPGSPVRASYTNRTWASMRVIRFAESNGVYVATIGSTDPQVLTYIDDLAKRYGNFIAPSPEILAELRAAFSIKLSRLLENLL